jgi:hypothetical protein
MAANPVTNNGWDFIAAATQNALNAQLHKLPVVNINAKTTQPIIPGLSVVIDLDIGLGPAQLRVRPGSAK